MNNLLLGLDNFFKNKSENEKWMIIFMITGVIGYLSGSLFSTICRRAGITSLIRQEEALGKS